MNAWAILKVHNKFKGLCQMQIKEVFHGHSLCSIVVNRLLLISKRRTFCKKCIIIMFLDEICIWLAVLLFVLSKALRIENAHDACWALIIEWIAMRICFFLTFKCCLMCLFSAIQYDSLAEWSKALASGASPQGRGFEPHSCHFFLVKHQESSDLHPKEFVDNSRADHSRRRCHLCKVISVSINCPCKSHRLPWMV